MANDVTKSPFIIDTAGSTVLQAPQTFVRTIRWVSPSASAGDLCIVQDANGREVFKSVAPGSNFVDHAFIFAIVQGIKVTTLGSGKVYIYFE